MSSAPRTRVNPNHTNPKHDKRQMRHAYVPRAIDPDSLTAALREVQWRKGEEKEVREALQSAGLYLTAEYVRDIDRYADMMSEPPSRAVQRLITQLEATEVIVQQEGLPL